MPSRRPVGRVLRKRAFHNGTELRETLPLWQRGRRPSRQKATEQTEIRPGQQQPRLFKVLGSAEDDVYRSVYTHPVGVEHKVVLADVGPLPTRVAAVVVGTAAVDALYLPCGLLSRNIEPGSDTGSGRVRAGSDEYPEDMRIVPENPVAETAYYNARAVMGSSFEGFIETGIPLSSKIISHSLAVEIFCSFSATNSGVRPICAAVRSIIWRL